MWNGYGCVSVYIYVEGERGPSYLKRGVGYVTTQLYMEDQGTTLLVLVQTPDYARHPQPVARRTPF